MVVNMDSDNKNPWEKTLMVRRDINKKPDFNSFAKFYSINHGFKALLQLYNQTKQFNCNQPGVEWLTSDYRIYCNQENERCSFREDCGVYKMQCINKKSHNRAAFLFDDRNVFYKNNLTICVFCL